MDTATDTPPPKRVARTPEERKAQVRWVAGEIETGRAVSELVLDYGRRFGRSRRQCFRDLKVARRKILLRVLRRAGGRSLAVALAERRLDMIYCLAFEAKDFKAALKAEEARCRLLCLYPDQPPADPFAPGPVRPDLQPRAAGTSAAEPVT